MFESAIVSPVSVNRQPQPEAMIIPERGYRSAALNGIAPPTMTKLPIDCLMRYTLRILFRGK